MEEVDAVLDDSIRACRRLFSKKGRLTRAIPGFVAREAQVDMACAVTEAIAAKQTLVVEAGTGTGKTYAYLVPSLLSRKKVIISTATKTLQDQLVQKDLPTLIRALGLGLRVQNLKGRSNYICPYRTTLFAQEGRFISPKLAEDIIHVYEALPKLLIGERNELAHISEEAPVWPYVTSTVDNCLGSDCPVQDSCHLLKARRRAMEADVVVINHHLFFADSKLKGEGFGDILPHAQVLIFDEAHQLPETASNFGGERVGTRQIRDLMDDILREWPVLDLVNQPLQQRHAALERLLSALLLAYPARDDKVLWDVLQKDTAFKEAYTALETFCQDLLVLFTEISLEALPGLVRCKERLEALIRAMEAYPLPDLNQIKWVERFKHSLVWHMTPVRVSDLFQEQLNREDCTYIFTSATLTMKEDFDSFTKPLGLDHAKTLMLNSPFEYQKQALLYLPRGLPDPKDHRYYDLLIKRMMPIITACGGRTFFLFTSYRGLHYVAEKLRPILNYPLLVQGEEAKPILLSRFREAGNAVLLGTSTFWEGVDVKGEALTCVMIDKLPFASPADPVMKGKMAHLEQQGIPSFRALSLPMAVIALKQGVGRLIRDVTDKGVLVIADPRLTAREYGRDIFESLPPLRKTRDAGLVLNFIKELALSDEPSSN